MKSQRPLSFLLLVVVSIVSSEVCSDSDSVSTLQDLEKRSRHYTLGKYDSILEDRFLSSGWYSTLVAGGTDKQYIMTDNTTIPPALHCGTYFPIYLKSPHPVLENGNQINDVQTCAVDFTTSCTVIGNRINIRKCKGKYQYYLTPTEANEAYCFDHQDIDDPAYAPPNEILLGNATVEVSLQYNVYNKDGGTEYRSPYLEFYCSFDVLPDLVYFVDWYVDKSLVHSTGPAQGSVRDATALQESVLLDKGYSLGIEIGCGVSAAWGAEPVFIKTQKKFSPSFFAGLKVHLNISKLTFRTGETGRVVLENTVPLGCEENSQQTSAQCGVSVMMFDPIASHQCSPAMATLSTSDTCGANLRAFRYDQWYQLNVQGINPCQTKTCSEMQFFVFSIGITTKNDVSSENLTIDHTMKIITGNTTHQLWKNYDVADIKVVVQDFPEWRKMCSASSDQITTSDGTSFTIQREGTFVLYRNKVDQIEIQQTFNNCVSGSSCFCSLVVRAGGDIVQMSMCQGFFVGHLRCTDNVLDFHTLSSTLYQIHTPTGTYVEVHTPNIHNIQIYIHMAPRDFNNTEGLCATFDGDASNDIPSSVDSFVASWSVEKASMDYRDVGNRRNTTCWPLQKLCVCPNASGGGTDRDLAVCSRNGQLYCSDNNNAGVPCNINEESDTCIYEEFRPDYIDVSTCFRYKVLPDGVLEYGIKPDLCSIEGECRSAGERSTSKSCLICSPNDNVYNWTVTVNKCFIDGTCMSGGTTNSAIHCLQCSVSENRTSWSVMDGSCFIGDTCISNGDTKEDASCLVCSSQINKQTWTLQEGNCFIGGVCYRNGERHMTDECYICDLRQNNYSWTAVDKCNEKIVQLAALDTGTISGIAAGGGVLLIIAIAVTTVLIYRRRKSKAKDSAPAYADRLNSKRAGGANDYDEISGPDHNLYDYIEEHVPPSNKEAGRANDDYDDGMSRDNVADGDNHHDADGYYYTVKDENTYASDDYGNELKTGGMSDTEYDTVKE